MTLAVSELFGPTFQGEGPSVGRRCSFVRLARCNLDCSWCDTPYTWDWDRFDPAKEITKLTVAHVADWLAEQDTGLVVITGGEPLLQARGLEELVSAIETDTLVEIETNGTRPPLESAFPSAYNVSLKLAHSGVDPAKAIIPRSIHALAATGYAVWKFVVQNGEQLDEVARLVEQFALEDQPVWIMPEGTTPGGLAERARFLAPLVLERGWNLTGRMHVDLWGGERGR